MDDKDKVVLLQSQLDELFPEDCLSHCEWTFWLNFEMFREPNKSRTSSYDCSNRVGAKKSISKMFLSTAFLNFCAISGCVHEAITVQLIGGHGLASV